MCIRDSLYPPLRRTTQRAPPKLLLLSAEALETPAEAASSQQEVLVASVAVVSIRQAVQGAKALVRSGDAHLCLASSQAMACSHPSGQETAGPIPEGVQVVAEVEAGASCGCVERVMQQRCFDLVAATATATVSATATATAMLPARLL